MHTLSTELYWLVITAVFTSMLWAPHILQRIMEMKPYAAFRDPKHDAPTKAPWAQRAVKAHTNAVENLVVFAALVLVVEISGAANGMTAMAVMAYFWLRVAHYVIYIAAVPWLRTPVYVLSWGCAMVLAYAVVG